MENRDIQFCEVIKKIIRSKDDVLDYDWANLVELARGHNVFPLFLEGACRNSSYMTRPESAQESNEALSIVSGQIRRTAAFLSLYEMFLGQDLHPLVLKGLICRQLYGELADHRPSSDEDILIRLSEYSRAKEVLIANGYILLTEQTAEEQLEQVQEISFVHPEKGLHIELHINPFGTENTARKDMNKYFEHVFDNYREVNINGVLVRTLTHQDHLLFLIFHAFRHFLGGGFGIRQMLDILLYQEQYGHEIDINLLGEQLANFRADTFWTDMIHIGNRYLGFELTALQEPQCPDELLEDMILCGTFGNATQAQRTASVSTLLTTEKYLDKNTNSSFVMVWKSVFPGKQYLYEVAPYLRKYPWLLPVAWIQRWGRFIRRSRKNKDNLAIESMKISQRRLKLLKKYDLA